MAMNIFGSSSRQDWAIKILGAIPSWVLEMKQHLPPSPLCTVRQNWKRNWSKKRNFLYKCFPIPILSYRIWRVKRENVKICDIMLPLPSATCIKTWKKLNCLVRGNLIWLLSVWKNVDKRKRKKSDHQSRRCPQIQILFPPVCLKLSICLAGSLAWGELSH